MHSLQHLLTIQIYLNDLDVSADYNDRMLAEIRVNIPQVYLETELDAVLEELDILGDLSSQFRSSSRSGLEQLFNQVTRPRLRPMLDECYRDVSYLLDEDAFADAEEHDVVRRRFVRAWEGIVEGFKVGSLYRTSLTRQDAFTDHNYQTFFNMTVETLVKPWEKMVFNMQFSEVS